VWCLFWVAHVALVGFERPGRSAKRGERSPDSRRGGRGAESCRARGRYSNLLCVSLENGTMDVANRAGDAVGRIAGDSSARGPVFTRSRDLRTMKSAARGSRGRSHRPKALRSC
jgi:hypothetical protein